MRTPDDQTREQLLDEIIARIPSADPPDDAVQKAIRSVSERVAELARQEEASPGDDSMNAQPPVQPGIRLVPDVPTDLADGVSREVHPIEQPPGRPLTRDAAAPLAFGLDAERPSRVKGRRHVPRRFIAMLQHRTVRWSLAAAAAAIAILVGVLWTPTGSRNPHAVFAQLVQQIASVRTITFKETVEVPGQPAITLNVMRMEPGRQRLTFPDGRVCVIDPSKGLLMLRPNEKRATLMQGTETNQQQDFFGELQKLREGAEEFLGQSRIDDRTATGFRARAEGGLQWVLWLDPTTNLPIRVEASGGILGGTKLMMSEFVFDVPLDESLLSLVPPEGYTMTEQQQTSLRPTEERLIEALRLYAELMDGEFPPVLDFTDVLKRVVPKCKSKYPAEADQVAARMKLAVGLSFIFSLSKDADWHYAGKGVKLGDAKTPIFWYTNQFMDHKPLRSRVIYGDLSARDIDPAQLPKP